MNKNELYDYYNSGKLQPIVQMCLVSWLNYWCNANIEQEIQDPLLLAQTKAEINLLLSDLQGQTVKVSILVLGDSRISGVDESEITEEIINTVVVSIMARCLRWLTGIEQISA